jgi:hypothetical protein
MPVGPPEAYRTYGIRMPRTTHFRALTCEQVECEHWAYGWVTRVDVSTELGVRQARYIETRAGRQFTKRRRGTMIKYTFPEGQRCFREHKEPNGRPSVLVTHRGDFRWHERSTVLGTEEWTDKFRTATETLAEWMRKG